MSNFAVCTSKLSKSWLWGQNSDSRSFKSELSVFRWKIVKIGLFFGENVNIWLQLRSIGGFFKSKYGNNWDLQWSEVIDSVHLILLRCYYNWLSCHYVFNGTEQHYRTNCQVFADSSSFLPIQSLIVLFISQFNHISIHLIHYIIMPIQCYSIHWNSSQSSYFIK